MYGCGKLRKLIIAGYSNLLLYAAPVGIGNFNRVGARVQAYKITGTIGVNGVRYALYSGARGNNYLVRIGAARYINQHGAVVVTSRAGYINRIDSQGLCLYKTG